MDSGADRQWMEIQGGEGCAKETFPYLIPYDELPEDVRQMDRDAIDNILPLFHEIGLRVYRVR